VQPAYKISTIALADGRVLNGIVIEQSGATLTVQTPTERLVLNRADVEEIRKSDLSLMPDGLLDVLPEKEIRDLLAYLMSPQQVSLPADRAPAASSSAVKTLAD
jgi:putative heme-binding domain-containing protein